MKIVVGTTYTQKIEYLKEVLDDIGIKAEVIPTKVESGVSDQPITEDETSKGSVNRARDALKLNPNADFGLGIEVGYQPNKKGDFEMFCCTSIADNVGFVQSCFSSRFLLPKFHQDILKENKNLGDYVRKYKEGVDKPVTNYVRELIRGRKPLVIEATRNVLLIYLEKIE